MAAASSICPPLAANRSQQSIIQCTIQISVESVVIAAPPTRNKFFNIFVTAFALQRLYSCTQVIMLLFLSGLRLRPTADEPEVAYIYLYPLELDAFFGNSCFRDFCTLLKTHSQGVSLASPEEPLMLSLVHSIVIHIAVTAPPTLQLSW